MEINFKRCGSYVFFNLLIIILIFIPGVVISAEISSYSSKLEKVSIRQEWFPNSNYAGAVFAKYEFAKHYGLEINIESGSDQIDPVKMVILGHNTFGDASADKILLANEKGANLVIIGVISYNSPTCFLAREENKIFTPKDFEGKTVGILTGTNTEIIYELLLRRAGVDRSKINEIEVPFDLTSFIVAGKYDVRPAFVYDEPVSLDLKKIKYTLIEPSQYGVRFMGTVYFTKKETIQNNPQIVQSFINAVADGWKAAIKYPKRAIDLLKIYDKTIDANRELLSLKKGINYFTGKENKILWADLKDWEEMVKQLQSANKIKKVDLDKTINNSFLINYYANENKGQ